MNFNEILDDYINKIGCNIKELSDVSGISSAVISRYRSGNRIPKYKSKQLDAIAIALNKLSNNKYSIDEIKNALESCLIKDNIDEEKFKNNLNKIISELNINVAELSRYIGYDASYISKIRSGIRKPLNISDFINSICIYIINNHYNESLKNLLNCDDEEFDNKELLKEKIYYWIANNYYIEEYNIDGFLKKLDDFDLNEYIKIIHFDKLRVPTLPKGLSKTKVYYGLDGFKQSQIDILKSIVLSSSKEDVFFYSNMEMISASKDVDFTKKFMIGLAMMLKKGLTLNIIHNLDRPFKELMMGLEGWIPLYMTGQIKSYYFKNNSNLLYSTIDCVGGTAALSGNYVTGNVNSARFLVTNKKEEIKHYKERARLLLKKASPLMDIYNANKQQEFDNFVNKTQEIEGSRKNILSNLPTYTMSDELLNNLLEKNEIAKSDRTNIIKKVNEEKNRIKYILKNNTILDEISVLSKEEFENANYNLDLSNIFYDEKKIIYSYGDYLQHIENIKQFKKENKNYDYKISKENIFKNINIYIVSDKQVTISKTNIPSIHFVFHHPKLINAISNFKVELKNIH